MALWKISAKNSTNAPCKNKSQNLITKKFQKFIIRTVFLGGKRLSRKCLLQKFWIRESVIYFLLNDFKIRRFHPFYYNTERKIFKKIQQLFFPNFFYIVYNF